VRQFIREKFYLINLGTDLRIYKEPGLSFIEIRKILIALASFSEGSPMPLQLRAVLEVIFRLNSHISK